MLDPKILAEYDECGNTTLRAPANSEPRRE